MDGPGSSKVSSRHFSSGLSFAIVVTSLLANYGQASQALVVWAHVEGAVAAGVGALFGATKEVVPRGPVWIAVVPDPFRDLAELAAFPALNDEFKVWLVLRCFVPFIQQLGHAVLPVVWHLVHAGAGQYQETGVAEAEPGP